MRLTPDGARYLAMARGERQPLPFHLRFGLPLVCGERLWCWVWLTYLSLAGCAAGVFALGLQHGLPPEQAGLAAGLWLGLPSVAFLARAPVLVDAPGLALALGAAVALGAGEPWIALGCAVIAAVAWEKAPIFAAVFALHPLPLVALIVPALRRLWVAPGAIDARGPDVEALRHPLRSGLAAHRGRWRDPFWMLTPWGVALAALAAPSGWLALAVAAGYAQLVVASDTTRLYQQAAPVVCIVAASVLPVEWAPALLVAHWMHPLRGEGT